MGHIHAGFQPPTNDSFAKMAFQGAKRIASKSSPPKKKKELLTLQTINKIIALYTPTGNILTLRFLVLCLISFAGFLRISEMLEIKLEDIQFLNEDIRITITKSKTDRLFEGGIVYISRLDSTTCPVYWLKEYIKATKLGNNSKAYLMCRLFKTKYGHSTPRGKSLEKLSYYSTRSKKSQKSQKKSKSQRKSKKF